MAMNQPSAGMVGGIQQGVGMGAGGGRQAQLVQQLRQMDQEQLIMLVLQLISRLQQIEGAQQQAQAGGQPQQPMR